MAAAWRRSRDDAPKAVDAQANPPTRRERLMIRRRERKRSMLEWVVVIVAAAVIALILRAWVVQTFYIP